MPATRSDDAPGSFGREIVLPDMQAVEARSDTEIGAVVHDELCTAADLGLEFARFVKKLSSAPLLVAVLQKRTAGADKLVGRGK